MSQFSPERSLTKDNIDKYGLDFINMVNLIVPNDTNATQNFFTRFIAFLNNFGNTNALQKCNIDPYFINLNSNQELVKIIDLLDNITAIKNKIDNGSFFSKLVNNSLTESDKNKFCYLLAYIRSTSGLFLSNYEKLKSQILGLEEKDKNDKDLKSIREQLHIDGDISSISATIDDIKAELPWDSLKYILGYNFNDSYILSALLYYKLGLYECNKFKNEFNTNINYSLIKSFIELLGDNFNKVTMLFDDDAAMFELEHFRNEYMGTNGAIDAKGLYDLLHIFTNTDKKDLSNYQVYAQTIDKQLKSTNPIVPSGENIKANNINSFNDIITLFGFDSHKIKSIDGFIQNLKKDNLKDLDIEKCSIVFKEYLGQVIKKFDEDFDKQDLSAFEKFVGNNVDDNSPIEKETIFVGYDSNDNAARVSLSQFLSIYSEVVSYALNDSNVKTNLTKLTNDIDAEIKKAFKQKTGLEFNFNFVNINDGLFVQMSEKDITPGNIKGIIDTLEVTSNRQVYKANTDMLVKNSLLNFLPDIFNLPIMTRFVNIMFGNENGKIYKYQKS